MLKVITEIGGVKSDKEKTKELTRLGTRIGIGIKIFTISSQSTALDHLATLPVILSNEQFLDLNRAFGKSTESISTG
jgi:hypothetical protein